MPAQERGQCGIVREVQSLGRELGSVARHLPPELANKFFRSSKEQTEKAQVLFERARTLLKEQDPGNYEYFFGAGEEVGAIVPFKKAGFHSRLFRFGSSHQHVMKVWSGEASSPALVDTSTRQGYEVYTHDERILQEVVAEVNATKNGVLDHALVKPRAAVWVQEEGNQEKGTLVEFLPMLQIVHSGKERTRLIRENPYLLEELQAIALVHDKLQDRGLGLDLVDKENLPLVMHPGGKPHFMIIDSGLEHSKEHGLRLNRIVFTALGVATFVALAAELYRHTRGGLRRGRSEQ